MENIKEQIRKLLIEAFELIQKSHENCYEQDGTPPNLYKVMSYAAACVSKYSAAEAIYWANPGLDDLRFFQILQQFDKVVQEARKFYEVRNNVTGFAIELMNLEDLLRL